MRSQVGGWGAGGCRGRRGSKRTRGLRVFQVLDLQLQLLDAHVPLVEELPQPADLLLLLVELHEQLRRENDSDALLNGSGYTHPARVDGERRQLALLRTPGVRDGRT